MVGPNILNTVKDLDRLRQIVGVLAKHGFGEVFHRSGLGSLVDRFKKESTTLSQGERLRNALQDLGPSFIKLGQIISTRPDVIPADIIDELKKLQDDVPPEPFEAVRPLIEGELGARIDELFETFDRTPLASASIGQVHRATLRIDEETVEEVVVKVQRPNVKETVELDLDLLYWLAHAIERSVPEARLYNPLKMVAEFDRAVSAELDFVNEADNAERFARNFEKKRYVRFPKVYRQASSRRVLTIEYFDGKKIHDAVASGTSGEAISKTSVDVMIQQIFEDGFFHADPHPGNMFILGEPERPVLAMIDLGLVGHLTPVLRDRTIDLMVAAVREDYRGVADALWLIGRPTKKIDREAYEAEVAVLAQKYLGKSLGDIELSALLRDLVDGARRYGIEIPSGFLMMGKALMTVEGVGKEIYPELDIFEEVKPYFLRLMQQRYSPERITQDVIRGVTRLSHAATEAPRQIEEILEDLRSGKFHLHVEQTSMGKAADKMGRRLFSGLVVAATILGGAVLTSTGKDFPGMVMIGMGMAYAAGHMSLLWLKGGPS